MEEQNEYGKFNEDDLKGWIEKIEKISKELEKQPKTSKPFTAYISCKTYGGRYVDFLSNWMCSDPECSICSSFGNALKELVNKDMGTLDYYDDLTSTKDCLEERIKTINKNKVEEKEFDPRNDAYERDQKRLRQRHYRNKKR